MVQEPEPLQVHHVDVFADRPLAGNGLTVVTGAGRLTARTMLQIAQELRQFETIFLSAVTADGADARIFTPEEELTFAGHPLLGAAAVLHAGLRPDAHPSSRKRLWRIVVGGRPLEVTTTARPDGTLAAEMDQGSAALSAPLARAEGLSFAPALGLRPEHLRADLPPQVVSTGLPYLILPVTPEGLAASHVAAGVLPDMLPDMLAEVGAAFVYVLDADRPEGRTWDRRGTTEDVATGSAAGPTAAYLVEHGRRSGDEPFDVHQGRFVGRPSRMRVRIGDNGTVHVGGVVTPFSSGTIRGGVATAT
jgi:PhzF family phenazine biosynthesis protein